MATLKEVHPISGEDINALPVKDLAPAITFFQDVLGFSTISVHESSAVLSRDHVRIGLVPNPLHEPKKAGSLAFAVDDLETIYKELEVNGGKPGKFGIDRWGGKQYRTFFLREEENGYCFCFYSPQSL